jgi:tetratricopeptide (TPR) repeat protein
MAKLAQNSGDQVVALQSIQTALVIWPDEPRWHAQAADICLALGDSRSAIDHLEQSVALEPAHLPHHMALGRAYSLNGDSRNAIHALEDAAKLNPNQMEPFLALAEVYQATNNLTKAATNADQAVTIVPDHLDAQLLRAEIALQMDEPEVAQEHAKAALRLKPEHPSALFVQARALQNLGCSAEALSIVEKAIPIAPDPLPLYLERVRLLECTLGPEVALESLQELAARYPDEPTVLAPLAQAFARAGQRDLAIRAAQRSLRNGNDSLKPTEQARLHFLLGRLLHQSGQLDQALHQLSEATRLVPFEVEPYLELGTTQLERRQHALALQTYQKAITIAPRDPRPYYQAGLALKTSRDYQGAENMLRRAADLAPDDLAIHRQLAALVALNLVHNRRSVTLDA